ncbi:LuxR C-terminal-related transcriptional regulator [Affinibrenneria salicis]|nr:LuxR C-terminal-related transcriptional regulator [Affinibrenneria salicis]
MCYPIPELENNDAKHVSRIPRADCLIFVLLTVRDLDFFLRFASDERNAGAISKRRLLVLGKSNLLALLIRCYKNIEPLLLATERCTVQSLDHFLCERLRQPTAGAAFGIKSILARCQMAVFISLLSGRQAKYAAQERNRSIKTIYAQRHEVLKKLNCHKLQDIYRYL